MIWSCPSPESASQNGINRGCPQDVCGGALLHEALTQYRQAMQAHSSHLRLSRYKSPNESWTSYTALFILRVSDSAQTRANTCSSFEAFWDCGGWQALFPGDHFGFFFLEVGSQRGTVALAGTNYLWSLSSRHQWAQGNNGAKTHIV